jgi:hypothetical protein
VNVELKADRGARRREQWWPALEAWREALAAKADDPLIPLNARTWKRWRDIVSPIVERYLEQNPKAAP